ncbi:MAG TPA: hypothetical protein VKA40_05095 [Nitrososphaera sp.]|nr:hypothetical protein [Nitrososphaera sp.]
MSSQEKQPTAKWRVVFSGCNHTAIMNEKELLNPIEAQFNPMRIVKIIKK